MKLLVRTALVGTLAAVAGTQAQAQAGLTSSVQQVQINATKNPVLSVVINSGGTQTLASLTDNAVNDFSTPVNVTTTWDVGPGAASVALVGYFTTPAQALSNVTAGTFITSSLMKGAVNGGAYNAFTGNAVGAVGSAGGSLTIFSQTTPNAASRNSNRTDNLALRLDLTGQPALVPGTYSGTLNLAAVTQ
ncbi:MAG TPA: hypothetical protein VFK09_11490 [Gemmatimonadales bacterium]|jgi:hypothetical protein|nr:hypothetical protein [Gemmatimonadales bacterium]